jgi:hypothetical protein
MQNIRNKIYKIIWASLFVWVGVIVFHAIIFDPPADNYSLEYVQQIAINVFILVGIIFVLLGYLMLFKPTKGKKEVWKNNKKIFTSNGSRPTIPPNIRHAVYLRDNYRCRQCGISSKDAELQIDHIQPYSKGGTDTLDNFQTLCKSCNTSKGVNRWKARPHD